MQKGCNIMQIIGLTGQTGAGKSTIAKLLKSDGYFHLDADLFAREIINESDYIKAQLASKFGEDIILPDGTVNRKILASRAFASPENTEALNQITHPAVIKATERLINTIKNDPYYKGFLIDAAVLFESGIDKLCDFTVAVLAPAQYRMKRIMDRDNITEAQAVQRMKAQKPVQYYTSHADRIIHNYPPFDVRENDQWKIKFLPKEEYEKIQNQSACSILKKEQGDDDRKGNNSESS